jgi:hypothetical protein
MSEVLHPARQAACKGQSQCSNSIEHLKWIKVDVEFGMAEDFVKSGSRLVAVSKHEPQVIVRI